MKRNLDKRFNWTAEQIELESLDWESNPADFDKLYNFVRAKLENWLQSRELSLETVIQDSELRADVRQSAGRFQEKFVSLPNYVYLRTKETVSRRLRKR